MLLLPLRSQRRLQDLFALIVAFVLTALTGGLTRRDHPVVR